MISTWANFLFERAWAMSWELNWTWFVNHFVLRDAFPVILSFWKCSYFSRTVLVRFWQGFWQEMEITKQISNGSWTNEIGHCSIVCHVRLVKIKESIISILRDFFEFRVNLKAFWILFVVRKKAKYFYLTEFNKRV